MADDSAVLDSASQPLPSSSNGPDVAADEATRNTPPPCASAPLKCDKVDGALKSPAGDETIGNKSSSSDNKDALSALTLLSFASGKAQGSKHKAGAEQGQVESGGTEVKGGGHSPFATDNLAFATSTAQQQQLHLRQAMLLLQRQQAAMAGNSQTLQNAQDINVGFCIDPINGMFMPTGQNFQQHPPAQNGHVAYPGAVLHHHQNHHVTGHAQQQQQQRQGEDEAYLQQQLGNHWPRQLPYVGSWVSPTPTMDMTLPPPLSSRQVTPPPAASPPIPRSSKSNDETVTDSVACAESGEVSVASRDVQLTNHSSTSNKASNDESSSATGTNKAFTDDKAPHSQAFLVGEADFTSRYQAPAPSSLTRQQHQQQEQQPTMPRGEGSYLSANMHPAVASPSPSTHLRSQWLLAAAQAPASYSVSTVPQFADGNLSHPQLVMPPGYHQPQGLPFDQAQRNYLMFAQQQQQQQSAYLHAAQAKQGTASYSGAGRMNGIQATTPMPGAYFAPKYSPSQQLDASAGTVKQLVHGTVAPGSIFGGQVALANAPSNSNYQNEKKTGRCRLEGCEEPVCGSRAGFCAAHAYGPRRCQFEGCTKCAQGGSRKFCISHGGGRRCQHPGCTKGARDRFFCAAHGGGKRCREPGCNKGAVGGTDRCTAHGGGRRCKSPGCPRSAQSGTNFCVCHGGGRTCKVDNCSRVARGRSQFCASHRSAKMCLDPGCEKYSMNYNSLCDDHQRSRLVPLHMLPSTHVMPSSQEPKQAASSSTSHPEATGAGIRNVMEPMPDMVRATHQQQNQFAWNNLQFPIQGEQQFKQRDVPHTSLQFATTAQAESKEPAPGLAYPSDFPFANAGASTDGLDAAFGATPQVSFSR